MFEIGQFVTLPGFAVRRSVEEIRQGPEGMEYRLACETDWYTEAQLVEAQQREQWNQVMSPRRGRIVRHRLGRRDRYGW